MSVSYTSWLARRFHRMSAVQIVSVAALTGLLAASLTLSGCSMGNQGIGGASKGGPTVATINGQIITKNEYDKIHEFFGKLMQVGSNPQLSANPIVTEVLKQMTIQKLVIMALVDQEAKKRGITVSDDDLKEKVDQQTKLAGGAGSLNALLTKQGMSLDEFQQSIKEQLLLDKVVTELAKGKLTPEAADVKAYYDQHPTEFQAPASIRSSHILVKAIEPEIRNELTSQNKDLKGDALEKAVAQRLAQQKAKAEKLLNDIKGDPTKFEEIAASQNDDTLAGKQKGDLGYMTEQATDPAYWQAVEATPVGKLNPALVKSSFGYHIVWVHDKKPARKLSFDEAKTAIAQQLEQKKKNEYLQGWLEKQQKTASIKIESAYEPLNPQQLKGQQGAAAGAPNAPAAPNAVAKPKG